MVFPSLRVSVSDCLTVFLPFSHPTNQNLKRPERRLSDLLLFLRLLSPFQPLAIVPLPALLPSSSSPPLSYLSAFHRLRLELGVVLGTLISLLLANARLGFRPPSTHSVHSLILFLFLPSATVNCQVHHADPVLSFIPTHRLFSFTMSAPGYYNGPPPPPQA